MLFLPKKYYKYINYIKIGHNCWFHLMENKNLKYDDLDTVVNTFHDSDSFKDFNPLYYIVNRSESKVFHSEGHIFNKYDEKNWNVKL